MLLGLRLAGCQGRAIIVFAACALLTCPTKAHADCGVPESGIPENAAINVDVAGIRKSVAESGFALGGFYAAETFGNPSGGIKQGAGTGASPRRRFEEDGPVEGPLLSR
jgi:hypothetical protein